MKRLARLCSVALLSLAGAAALVFVPAAMRPAYANGVHTADPTTCMTNCTDVPEDGTTGSTPKPEDTGTGSEGADGSGVPDAETPESDTSTGSESTDP